MAPAPTPDADGLIQMIRSVMDEVEAPQSFKDIGVKEEDYLESLERWLSMHSMSTVLLPIHVSHSLPS